MACSSATERLALGASASLLIALAAGPAHASPSAAEAALAQASFDEARRLFGTGHVTEACEKFGVSEKLDPRGGTLLNLAICHEKEGKSASAWLDYSGALAMARNEGNANREKFAKEHAERLAAQLSHVQLNVAPDARLPGLVVKFDGAPIQAAAWGTALPVDPGAHTLEASETDHKTWSSVVTVAANGDQQVVDVPPLAANAVTAKAPLGEKSAAPESGSGRLVGVVVGGASLASVVVGAVFGVMAIDKRHAAVALCANDGPCGAAAQSTNSEGVRDAWASDVAIGVGVVGLAVGTYLVLAGKAAAPPTGSPTLAVTGRGLSLRVVFR